MTAQPIGAVANKIVNSWSWWQEALAHPDLIGSIALPLHESDPKQGYFRCKTKGGNWDPVAIFYPEESEVLVAYRNGREVKDVNALWTWCCRNPVSYEAYEKAVDGVGWDDEPKPAATIGDNSGDADNHEALRIEYLGEKETAEAFLKSPVTTQADADKAAIWAKRLSDITKRAEEFHATEKRPHLDAGRAVDDRWRELKEAPKELSTRLKRSIDAFAAEQRRIEEARARKAREDEERLRREAAELARKANESDQQSAAERDKAAEQAHNLQAEADRKAKEAEVKNFTAGRTGARVATRPFTYAEITDFDILLMALKDREEIRELVQSLANRAAKSGFALVGMKIRTEERVV